MTPELCGTEPDAVGDLEPPKKAYPRQGKQVIRGSGDGTRWGSSLLRHDKHWCVGEAPNSFEAPWCSKTASMYALLCHSTGYFFRSTLLSCNVKRVLGRKACGSSAWSFSSFSLAVAVDFPLIRQLTSATDGKRHIMKLKRCMAGSTRKSCYSDLHMNCCIYTTLLVLSTRREIWS